MNHARILKRRRRDLSVKNSASELFEKYKNNPLFLSGVVLYWAEGTRLNKNYRRYQLAFTNSDSKLLSFYSKFLQRYFRDIDSKDWRIGLFLYPDIDSRQAISYWSHILRVPREQFIKPQILTGQNIQNKKLKFGTCCLYINSKDACLRMQTWIDAIGSQTRR